jgi:hypothetical protein
VVTGRRESQAIGTPGDDARRGTWREVGVPPLAGESRAVGLGLGPI